MRARKDAPTLSKSNYRKASHAVIFHTIGNGGSAVARRQISGKWIITCAVIIVLIASATASIFDWRRQSSPDARLKARPVDSEVANLMMKARARRAEGTGDAFERAVIHLNEAIRRDPKYAEAYADLAGA